MQARVNAYAKINLFLDILGKRDDGYHEVSMIMQTIKLADYLALEEYEENILLCSHQFLPVNDSNLALKALLLMQEIFPQIPKVKILLEKHIPIAAGLAGGSADAAAVITGLNELFSLKQSPAQLAQIGARLGSDIPFCLLGGTALAEGRGEKMTTLPDLPHFYLVLVKPKIGLSTAGVYKSLVPADYATHPDSAKYITAIQRGDTSYITSNLYNTLEKSAFRLQPQVGEIKNEFKRLGANYTLMSGSGSTIFSLFEDKTAAWDFYNKIKPICKSAYFSETISSDIFAERVSLI